jgi:hypothetical protein
MDIRPHIISIIGFLVSCVICAPISFAEPHTAPSLEWMTVSSPLIIRGRVLEVQRKPIAQESFPELALEELIVQVAEVLKGEFAQEKVYIRRFSFGLSHSTALTWKESDVDFLFFLTKDIPETDLPMILYAEQWTLAFDYPYGPVNLLHPQEAALYLVSATFEAPQSGEHILKIVRDTLANLSNYRSSPKVIEVPYDTEAFQKLWGRSSCYVIVPAGL